MFAEAVFMFKNEYLNLGTQEYSIANGEIAEGTIPLKLGVLRLKMLKPQLSIH
jgi:hypothetical protein